MRSPKTVLVPLDGSTSATAAMPVARELSKLLRGNVAVLHVTDDALAPDALPDRVKLLPEEARGLVIECRAGAAAELIVQEAVERHAAMIVMCPRIRTDLHPHALGSVALAVLRAAPCPTVLVPSARGHKSWALRRLLVPHDGTPTSAATIRPATDFALMATAELVVLHVAAPASLRPTEPGTFISPRYIDQPQHEWPTWKREFLDRLMAVGGTKDEIALRFAVGHGDAGEVIVDYAQHCDLIVMGWRGGLEPDRAQTIRHVIRHTICPVIVFRLDQDDDR
jgi:nucleotide-binding universal stress UspA family protein